MIEAGLVDCISERRKFQRLVRAKCEARVKMRDVSNKRISYVINFFSSYKSKPDDLWTLSMASIMRGIRPKNKATVATASNR